MTLFAGAVDHELTMPIVGVPDSPVRPAITFESTSPIISIPGIGRRVDAERRSDLSELWKASVTQSLNKARKRVENYPESMTARSRLADSALLADEEHEAAEEALKTLEIGLKRLKNNGSGSAVDVPAVYVAAQVLLRLGKGSAAKDHLRMLSRYSAIAHLYADLLVTEADLDEALEVLRALDISTSGVASLLGYILAVKGRHNDAITALRAAQRVDPTDVDSTLNLALAFWRSGSPKKAIRWARYSAQVSPSRSDAIAALLHYLVETNDADAAEREVRSFRKSGAVETPELAVAQACIAAAREDHSQQLTMLRRARVLAMERSDPFLAAELEGAVAIAQFAYSEIDRAEALQRVRSAIRRASSSPTLVAILADLVNRSSNAAEVRQAFAVVVESKNPSAYRSVICRLAFLEGRYEDARRDVLAWHNDEPCSERAATLSTFWDGMLSGDWHAPARRAKSVVAKLGPDKRLVNAATYALALSGHGHEALDCLAKVGTVDFVLLATSGLTHLSIGNIEQGMKMYRLAALQADRHTDAKILRTIMTLHQAMVVRRFRLLETDPLRVRALALPAIDLPEKWSDNADLRFLAEVARRRGWPWPVFID